MTLINSPRRDVAVIAAQVRTLGSLFEQLNDSDSEGELEPLQLSADDAEEILISLSEAEEQIDYLEYVFHKLETAGKFDEDKHDRYPPGTIIDGQNVGGKFKPKSGQASFKDKAKNALSNAKKSVTNAANKVKGLPDEALAKRGPYAQSKEGYKAAAKDAAKEVRDNVKQAAKDAGDKAKNAAINVGRAADKIAEDPKGAASAAAAAGKAAMTHALDGARSLAGDLGKHLDSLTEPVRKKIAESAVGKEASNIHATIMSKLKSLGDNAAAHYKAGKDAINGMLNDPELFAKAGKKMGFEGLGNKIQNKIAEYAASNGPFAGSLYGAALATPKAIMDHAASGIDAISSGANSLYQGAKKKAKDAYTSFSESKTGHQLAAVKTAVGNSLSAMAKKMDDAAGSYARSGGGPYAPTARGSAAKVADQARAARDAAGKAVGDAKDAAGKAIGDARDKVGQKLNDAKQAAGATLDRAKEAARNNDQVRGAIASQGPYEINREGAKGAASEPVKAASKALNDAANTLKGEAKDAFSSAKASVEDAAEAVGIDTTKLKSQIQNLPSTSQQKVNDLLGSIQQAYENMTKKATESGEPGDNVKSAADFTKERAEITKLKAQIQSIMNNVPLPAADKVNPRPTTPQPAIKNVDAQKTAQAVG